MFGDEVCEEALIATIATEELEAGVGAAEGEGVLAVGEVVKDGDAVALFEEKRGEDGADVTSPAGDEDGGHGAGKVGDGLAFCGELGKRFGGGAVGRKRRHGELVELVKELLANLRNLSEGGDLRIEFALGNALGNLKHEEVEAVMGLANGAELGGTGGVCLSKPLAKHANLRIFDAVEVELLAGGEGIDEAVEPTDVSFFDVFKVVLQRGNGEFFKGLAHLGAGMLKAIGAVRGNPRDRLGDVGGVEGFLDSCVNFFVFQHGGFNVAAEGLGAVGDGGGVAGNF